MAVRAPTPPSPCTPSIPSSLRTPACKRPRHPDLRGPAHVLDGDVIATFEGGLHLRAEDEELARAWAGAPTDPLGEEGERITALAPAPADGD